MSDSINIEVVYGLPDKQSLLSLKINKDSSVQQAIEASGIQQLYPDIDFQINKVGIWNRVCKLTDPLSEGARIEIYRPLVADPKEVRKRRAERAKEEGRADKVTGGRLNSMKAAKAAKSE